MNEDVLAERLFVIYAAECARLTGDPVGLRWEAVYPHTRRAWVAVARAVLASTPTTTVADLRRGRVGFGP